MATTTPNFGWAVPTSTDLVKDGAVAIETLGDAIDASLVDLKGGTTGQVLAKASNTDMDFTWATDASGIPATIFDAKGDIIAATAADTASRLAVGTNGQVLTADSTAATGIKWATPSGGKVVQIVEASTTSTLSTTSGTYADITGVTATITPTSASNKILVMVNFGAIYPTTSSSGTTYGAIKLLRGATDINETSLGWYLAAGTTGVGDFYFSHTLNQIDSPATTSATTYKCQHKRPAGTAFYSNTTGGRISIILMEVTV